MFAKKTKKTTAAKIVESKIRSEERRNKVRIWSTHLASLFMFAGGLLLMIAGFLPGVAVASVETSFKIFMFVFPIASSITAYWFGARTMEVGEKIKDKKE